MYHNPPPADEQEVRRPDKCPFCQSGAVGTLAKAISAATYWRCQACGEVWNLGRLARTQRGPRGRSW